jgi:thiol-disulfide isomerase/thioredoxin
MIEIINVKEKKNIEKFNAAAKKAYDHPDTHGLLVKIYADWCGHCRVMTADWNRLMHELKTKYQCKKPGCVLTIANIRAVNLEQNDPVLQNLRYIPKDIQSIPTIMYISNGARGLEYSKDRTYAEMLNWIINHPDFSLVPKVDRNQQIDSHTYMLSTSKPLRRITKKARTKFRHFHRDTLKRFHEEMKRNHNKSVKSRFPTPVANYRNVVYVPAYLQK